MLTDIQISIQYLTANQLIRVIRWCKSGLVVVLLCVDLLDLECVNGKVFHVMSHLRVGCACVMALQV